MKIQPTNNISFGYSNIIKTLYKKGKLPNVQYGFYGDEITKKTVTLEHLLPISKKGKTILSNLVLASANRNQARGTEPLSGYIDFAAMGQYLKQFENVKVKDFDGNKYIQLILKTVSEVLAKGE